MAAMTHSTCDLYDQHEERLRVLPPLFHDFGARSRFSGEAVTVQCFEDNSRVKELLSTPGTGKVLVVDGGASARCALMGDLIAAQAVAHGWEGVVIYGFVRDRVALAALPLGIKALGSTPRKSVRRGEGRSQIAIDLGGVACLPGDRVIADEDGIVLLNASSST
jgi:regulator of ribonuclease activity A